MQKKIIALAVAGLVSGGAFAQSNVTISGLLTGGYGQLKQGSTVATTTQYSTESHIRDNSSRLIFSGKEDLGGGLSAVFQIDNRLTLDTGTFAANGNTWLGLSHTNMGSVVFGQADLYYGEASAGEQYRAAALLNMVQNGLGTQVQGVSIANATRTPNMIKWDSPNWNGVTARVAYSTAWAAGSSEGSGKNTGLLGVSTGDAGEGHAWNTALRYANGPLNLGVSFWAASNESGIQTAANTSATAVAATAGTALVAAANAAPVNNEQKGGRVGGSYDFPMGLRVGIAFDRSHEGNGTIAAKTTLTRSSWVLPISYSWGAHRAHFTYGKAGQLRGSGTTIATNDTAAKIFTLGYDYAMSKRTNVGVYYTKLNNNVDATYQLFGNGAGTQNTAGEDASFVYGGMNHSF